MRRPAEQAWRLRWGAMLGCAAARAVASSLLDSSTSMEETGGHQPHWVSSVSLAE